MHGLIVTRFAAGDHTPYGGYFHLQLQVCYGNNPVRRAFATADALSGTSHLA
ncbi:MAG: hypothetical protein QOI71_1371 [Gaiellales bacterium]|jgi:hypothetical protein|nr:hypothetical protein [Gaiellales bacterium]